MMGALSVIHGFWCLRPRAALAEIEVVTPRAIEEPTCRAGHMERDSRDAIHAFLRVFQNRGMSLSDAH
ncbi:hypothetical protein ELI13_16500 [Rhizobium ruizarguesonis]|nr:hypothetical protein ELI48_17715 [Rhizobium ruizarguesonis]TAU69660.1 hypothetical protein ELI45_18460 [Rhizobium ruizarguesonis]TAV17095.1 hypothetical protein ELI34_17630 [Rhizobium ruizarguesonis]TAV29601.1 hypothetical protein ELI35_19220 [Rhizobium ruizarguesonis]TAW11260.1 hypothetical protein ELI26_17775 [Rhizobium ruizarguesonis]